VELRGAGDGRSALGVFLRRSRFELERDEPLFANDPGVVARLDDVRLGRRAYTNHIHPRLVRRPRLIRRIEITRFHTGHGNLLSSLDQNPRALADRIASAAIERAAAAPRAST
jgi:hypothetical protein